MIRKQRKGKPESSRPPIARYPYEAWLHRLNAIFPPHGRFIEPLSNEWRQARRGRLTASTRAEIIYKRNPKSWNLLADKIEKELSSDYLCPEDVNVKALNWGRKHEPEAIANITLEHGRDVVNPGLIFHQQHPFIAGTPDGLVIENGRRISVQIKCPYDTKRHLDVLYHRALKDPTYFYQSQWEAWLQRVTNIEFYSYDPRQPLPTRLVRLDIPVDKKVLDTFEAHALEFAGMFCSGIRMATGRMVAEGVILPYGG